MYLMEKYPYHSISIKYIIYMHISLKKPLLVDLPPPQPGAATLLPATSSRLLDGCQMAVDVNGVSMAVTKGFLIFVGAKGFSLFFLFCWGFVVSGLFMVPNYISPKCFLHKWPKRSCAKAGCKSHNFNLPSFKPLAELPAL